MMLWSRALDLVVTVWFIIITGHHNIVCHPVCYSNPAIMGEELTNQHTVM